MTLSWVLSEEKEGSGDPGPGLPHEGNSVPGTSRRQMGQVWPGAGSLGGERREWTLGCRLREMDPGCGCMRALRVSRD